MSSPGPTQKNPERGLVTRVPVCAESAYMRALRDHVVGLVSSRREARAGWSRDYGRPVHD